MLNRLKSARATERIMTINLYFLACVALASGALLRYADAVGPTNKKGDGAPWGSYFSRGFGGFYSPDDFAPDPPRRLEHQRGRTHSLHGAPDDGYDDTQRTLGRGDLVQGEIPTVPDAQSRNIPYDSKQPWAQDTQQDMQHDWAQDTQQDFQDDTQQDFQDDTQQDFQDDIQHNANPHDFTGYPPAKGHHRPEVPKHTTPVFHHTTYQPPVQHTTYQPEPPVQHTTYQPEPPVQHTTYQPEPPVQHTTNPTDDHTLYQTPTPEYQTPYQTETTERHTTYPAEYNQHTTTEYPTERTTYDSYDTTKHPGSSDYETTMPYPLPHGPSDEGICQPNPAAKGYPPGTKLICTVEIIICDPIGDTKSQKGTKTTGKSTTLVCKPFSGCDKGYTTGNPEYTTRDHGYTTEGGYTTQGGHTTEGGYTTEGGFTTGKPEYTTEGGYTTDKPGYTTEKIDYTTDKPVHTTEKPAYTTERVEYPTTHPVTSPPVHTTPKPTELPHTTPHDEETTPCVNRPGVKGRSRNCGVKGVKGVKGGYRQPSWSSWSSWNPWGEWESKRQGLRKQQMSWLPQTQERRIESARRPVWNGAWPASFGAAGPAPVYADF